MTTLRKAAQQALEALQEYQSNGAPFLACDEAVAALRAALAQQDEPAQEPVAWRYKPMIGSSWSLSDDGYYISCKRDKGYIVDSLYTAPPQRQPLTQEEIDRICASLGFALISPVEIARAIERAHGIGEQP